ncbi:MAG: hypothetical protein RQ966_06680 [Acetobacteraceae bacterium]|nr:hypothetical protein [Acetobacteraceae bacterium]
MTDEPARPDAAPSNSDPDANPPRVQVRPSDPSKKRDFLPLLYLVGFLVLAGSLVYLWQNPPVSPVTTQQAGRVDTLQTQIAALRDQVSKLSEQKPTGPSAADVAKLQQQVSALENRPAVAPAAVADLSDKVTALEKKEAAAPDAIKQLSDKVTELENRKTVTPDQLAPLADKVQALEQRPTYDPASINGKFSDLSDKMQNAQDAEGKLSSRLDGLEKQVSTQGDQLKALTQKVQVTARLQSVATALASGQKLGDIPGAPPALARFANEAPPTEAALRESFNDYGQAAEKADQPVNSANADFGSRLWNRAQQVVTVRQGDHVLVGNPIAGVIANAREKLDNGDLAGSVKALKGLEGPAAAAMQPWVDKAQSLVAARSAIASLAAN